MGACLSHQKPVAPREVVGLGPLSAYEDPIPALKRELSKDVKRIVTDSFYLRAKIGAQVLSKADLQRAYDFVELQMLLPRRNCIDTQVLILSVPQLACCGMLLQQPSLSSQCACVQNISLHILFEVRPFNVEAHGVALANLARLLAGNTSLERLCLNFMGITLDRTSSLARKIFSRTMESFAAMLCINTTLSLLRFEGMMSGDDEVPWSEGDAELVCKAQSAHQTSLRLAFLMARHPRCRGASPLARKLPRDLVQRVLDTALPLRPLCKVEFDFFREDSYIQELALLPIDL